MVRALLQVLDKLGLSPNSEGSFSDKKLAVSKWAAEQSSTPNPYFLNVNALTYEKIKWMYLSGSILGLTLHIFEY